ncbi:UDP-N-acetylmuramate dehydrogenase [Ignatzschineria sp. LJL83]
MKITESQSLENYNSFGVAVDSCFFVTIEQIDDLEEMRRFPEPHLFLGGGSNILFTKDYSGTVFLNALKGIELISEQENTVLVRAMGGENWHDFVEKMKNSGIHGLEYLALIPGTVGAAPVQNIGAYGAEVGQYIEAVEVFDTLSQQLLLLSQDECEFAYRDSIFKQNRGRYFITAVTFRLYREMKPIIKYQALEQFFIERGQALALLEMPDVFDGVVAVRSSKLPDPKIIGNGGSFFKNPIVNSLDLEDLLLKYPNLVWYPQNSSEVKLAAGQLIELAGFKGSYDGCVGMYEKQALVLVNLGGATGEALWRHALKVQEKVYQDFGVLLEPEPLIL